MNKLAVFASGAGSNAVNIYEYLAAHRELGIEVAVVVSDKANAPVLGKMEALGVPSLYINKESYGDPAKMLEMLAEYGVDWIILAGFLKLIPSFLIEAFPRRIVNIHPALLPSYGGKGMYGARVHEAVVANKETQSGITIHFVNERYDEGEHLFQATCPVLPTDTPDDVATKVHALEYAHFPRVIAEAVQR